MTRRGTTPEQRDIVLIPVPFSDLSSVKRRPVLVLSNNRHNRHGEDVVVAAITSQLSRRPLALDITEKDLEVGVLPRDSQVRADKLYTLSKRIIIRRFGRLHPSAFAQVIDRVDQLWGP